MSLDGHPWGVECILHVAILLITEVGAEIARRLILMILLQPVRESQTDSCVVPTLKGRIGLIGGDALTEFMLHPLNELEIILIFCLDHLLDLLRRMGTSMCLAMPKCSKQLWSILKLKMKSISSCACHLTRWRGTFPG